ncbi:hypothetical protein QAD02_007129 [Eretmocerus hayati]|uniref:Uncharacterized protein n=1 Tax=Eretmocerus hayati TaxID=131215 RepID=A0ACC2N353_9HYME|nr:hypothetical protein QAD02_007129 [Eretmocerus hayati]
MSILDLSKMLMYAFHYDDIKKKGFKRCDLLHTDTDSLIYEIHCNDLYKEVIRRDCKTVFDTSNYDSNNPFAMPVVNRKQLGYFSDELGGKILQKFIGIGAEMYALIVNQDDVEVEKKIAKGVSRNVLRNVITFNDFYKCMFEGQTLRCEQKSIRNKFHCIFTTRENKIALRRNDDKRWCHDDHIHTLPWGYYKLEEN